MIIILYLYVGVDGVLKYYMLDSGKNKFEYIPYSHIVPMIITDLVQIIYLCLDDYVFYIYNDIL